MKPERPRPTEAELSILRVLWENGPLSVRAVLKHLNDGSKNKDKVTGYTTVLKLMQIMTDKGLVARDEFCRPQIYRPCDPQAKTQRQLLRHMLDRVFGGSTRAMVLQALSQKKTSAGDLKEIEKLLDRIEGENQGVKR
jgi:BlaI family transcriptional regulator, penicillinase repressor